MFLFALLYFTPVGLWALGINDILSLLLGICAATSLLMFGSKKLSYYFVESFAFNAILISSILLLLKSFMNFLGGESEPLIDSVIRFIRASSFVFYLYGSIYFMKIFFPSGQLRDYGLLRKRVTIIITVLTLLSFSSLLYSLVSKCSNIVYGGRFCIVGITSYSSNGYISAFSIFLLILSYLYYRSIDSRCGDLNYSSFSRKLNYIFTISIITLLLPLANSGSRGAFISLIAWLSSFLCLIFLKIVKSLAFRINRFSLLIILSSLVLIVFASQTFSLRAIKLLYLFVSSNDSNIASAFYSKRFERDMSIDLKSLVGDGNFSLNESALGSSFYDGTLQYFYVSFGIIGLICLLLFLVSAFITMSHSIKTAFSQKSLTFKFLTNSAAFSAILALIISSFPNELGTLNSIAPFYFLVLAFSGFIVKYDS